MNKYLKQKLVEALLHEGDEIEGDYTPPGGMNGSPGQSPTNKRPITDNPIQPPGPPGKGSAPGGIGAIGRPGLNWPSGPHNTWGDTWQLPNNGPYYPNWTDDNPNGSPEDWKPKPGPYIPGIDPYGPDGFPPSGYNPGWADPPPGKPVYIPGARPDQPGSRPARTTPWQRGEPTWYEGTPFEYFQ